MNNNFNLLNNQQLLQLKDLLECRLKTYYAPYCHNVNCDLFEECHCKTRENHTKCLGDLLLLKDSQNYLTNS